MHTGDGDQMRRAGDTKDAPLLGRDGFRRAHREPREQGGSIPINDTFANRRRDMRS